MSTPLVWYTNNYGDDLSAWLVTRLTGCAVRVPTEEDPIEYMAIGSILNHATTRTIAWGTGIAWAADSISTPREIRAVRGPLTWRKVRACGHSCPTIWGDPALLLPELLSCELHRHDDVVLVPHHVDYHRVFSAYEGKPGIRVVDVRDPRGVSYITQAIVEGRCVYSSSLHGLIVAQAYGCRWDWVEFSPLVGGGGFKFLDHFAAMDLPWYSPHRWDALPSADVVGHLSGRDPVVIPQGLCSALRQAAPWPIV